jgi:NAD(P)-dependent dehydrogenase (short-subunit alcohol dehydrogenase family)
MKLKDQTVLTNGSSRGIGEAIARALAVGGPQITITGCLQHDKRILKNGINVYSIKQIRSETNLIE